MKKKSKNKLRPGTIVTAWFNGEFRPGVVVRSDIRLAYYVKLFTPAKVAWSSEPQSVVTCNIYNVRSVTV